MSRNSKVSSPISQRLSPTFNLSDIPKPIWALSISTLLMTLSGSIVFTIAPHYLIDVLKLNEDLRVKYMTNQISKEKFKTLIQRNDKRHQKYNEITDVLNLVVTGATDIINRFANNLNISKPNEYDLNILNELNELDKSLKI